MAAWIEHCDRIRSWQEGVSHFNAGNYWSAHEAWERGWMVLDSLEKLYIQFLIQSVGAFHLVSLGRTDAAMRLAARALQKREQVELLGGIAQLIPRIEILRLELGLAALISGHKRFEEISMSAELLLC